MKKILFLIILLSFLHSYADAQIALTGNITTIGVTSYPTHIDSLGKGGYMTMPTTAARDAIPTLRRKKGMLVYVQDIDVLYRLGSATLDNSNWVVVSLLSATSNIQTFLASPTSANLSAAITDEAGSSNLVFSNNPSLTNATLSGTLTLTTPLSVANGGTGTKNYTTGDLLYASATNTLSKLSIGSTGNVLTVSGGVPTWGVSGLYTLNGITANDQTFATTTANTTTVPSFTSSGTVHTLNIPYAGVTGTTAGLISYNQFAAFDAKQSALNLTSNIQTFLATPTSSNLAAAITDEAGSNSLVFSNNPTLSNATLSGTLTLTAPLTAVNGGTGQSSYAIGDILYASSTSALSRLTKGTEGQVLLTSGTGIPTWGSNGLYTLNGQSAITHTFATANTASADFTITTALGTGTLSNTSIHTFNLPNAGLSTRGLVSVVDQSFKGVKTFESDLISNTIFFGRGNSQGTNSPGLESNLSIGVGTKNFSTSTGGNSTQGINNIAIGRRVLASLTIGSSNNAIGYEALKNNTTGYNNNAFGYTALSANTTGFNNTAFGDQALQGNNGTSGDAGSNNTAVGWTSLVNNQTGYQNTAIGSASGVNSSNLYNTTAIGYFAKASTSNTIQLGNTEVTSVVTSGTLSATGATVANLKLTRGTPTLVGAVLTATATDGTVGWSTSTNATSLSGGVAGAIPFQTAPSVTGFTAAGTSGQILVSAGTSTPTWTSNITVGTATATSLVTNSLRVTEGSPTAGSILTANNADGTVGFTAQGTSGQILVSAGTAKPTWTSNITVGTVTATSASVTTLNASSLVLTGNLTATSANFSRAVTGAPAAAFTSTSTTTIDFSSSNLAYSGQNSKDFTLSNLRDGGTYTLAWQNTFTGLTATFTSAGFSFVSLGNYAVVTNKNAVYTFVVMGSTVYYSMVSAQ